MDIFPTGSMNTFHHWQKSLCLQLPQLFLWTSQITNRLVLNEEVMDVIWLFFTGMMQDWQWSVGRDAIWNSFERATSHKDLKCSYLQSNSIHSFSFQWKVSCLSIILRETQLYLPWRRIYPATIMLVVSSKTCLWMTSRTTRTWDFKNLCTLDFMVGSRVEIERLEGFQSDIDTCHISDLLASVEATAQRSHENIRKIEMRTQLIILILITLVSSIPE